MSLKKVPWIRVLAEGVVIVGSILLAFAIDAGWDTRQDREREHEYLDALHREFLILRDELQEDQDVRESMMGAAVALVEEPFTATPAPRDSILRWLGLLQRVRGFFPSNAVYDDLIASGATSLLRSNDLRAALGAYDQSRDRLILVEEMSRSTWFEGLGPYLIEHTDLISQTAAFTEALPVRSTGDPRGILSDRKFRNLVSQRWVFVRLAHSWGNSVEASIEEIIRLTSPER